MVGGTVIGIARKANYTLLHVEKGKESCAVKVVERRKSDNSVVDIQLGDSVWWQGDNVMWSPKTIFGHGPGGCGTEWDIKIFYLK